MKMRGTTKEPVAILGYSCRFASANTPEEYWNVLINGIDATCTVPNDRPFAKEIEGHITRGGFLKCPVDELDAEFFHVNTDHAPFLDPQQRLVLEVTWEALERSAINPHSLRGTNTGVFVGAWSNDYEKVIHASNAVGTCDPNLGYLSCSLGAIGTRLASFFGTQGPHKTQDAGCASSLWAVHDACQKLQDGTCDLAIAAGTHLILYPPSCRQQSLVFAPDGRSKPFDAKVDGYGRGEGFGTVILKRLSDAVRDGDPIQAVVRGITLNSDATSATFGTPCKYAEAKLLKQTLANAGIDPRDVDFVEAHATGTELGDSVEVKAIESAYGGSDIQRNSTLYISSVKGNIGHAEGAAGMAGLIKVLLSLKHGMIPPQVNLNKLSPFINLKSIPAEIPLEPVKWLPQQGKNRMAAVSGFALGGHGAHIIVEQFDNANPKMHSGDNTNVADALPLKSVHISAKTLSALDSLKLAYVEFLNGNSQINFENFVHTVNCGRSHDFEYEITATGRTCMELAAALSNCEISHQKCVKNISTPECKNCNEIPRIHIPITYPFERQKFWVKRYGNNENGKII